ncbi:MAG TPA: preprotein translocase subunit SecE [Candidatus Binatia bacterium]|nr:preprotein translocase subunit SecE [Candidatus Binatia bacterium]
MARPGIVTAASEYIKDVRVEMSKVSWPTREELRESTLVVIVMVFVIAIFIGIVDRGLSLAFEAIIKMVG